LPTANAVTAATHAADAHAVIAVNTRHRLTPGRRGKAPPHTLTPADAATHTPRTLTSAGVVPQADPSACRHARDVVMLAYFYRLIRFLPAMIIECVR
jgi:hypothetical protein